MNPTEPLTQIGKYKILSELGRGGMGVVYRAEDRFIGREVAIKTLVDASPAMRQRFAIEARSGVLNHPNIVTIYDFGEHEDSPYIVMEFLHGQTLDRIVKEEQPLALVDKLDIVRQVCEGLGYAHSRGVVHRDIKPANVVLLESGRVKLVDFGIAQLESLSGHTMAGSVIGTYQYLSPERLKGEASDGRGDIWSAGVVLYLLLTGTLPFPGEDISALHRVITDPYPPLGSRLSTAYPESLDNIMARALAKEPERRYSSALEMAGDLEATRDAIRLSKVEDLLGQVRTLIDKDELLRARPLLLDLQRLAPQNTAVRKMLREVGERLQVGHELRPAMPAAEAGKAAGNGQLPGEPWPGPTPVPPQDPPAFAETQEEERRRRIIDQIVAEIRAQAGRGNEARALELVQRSLQRAPGNAALLALGAEIQARIDTGIPEQAPPEPHVLPEEATPAAAEVQPIFSAADPVFVATGPVLVATGAVLVAEPVIAGPVTTPSERERVEETESVTPSEFMERLPASVSQTGNAAVPTSSELQAHPLESPSQEIVGAEPPPATVSVPEPSIASGPLAPPPSAASEVLPALSAESVEAANPETAELLAQPVVELSMPKPFEAAEPKPAPIESATRPPVTTVVVAAISESSTAAKEKQHHGEAISLSALASAAPVLPTPQRIEVTAASATRSSRRYNIALLAGAVVALLAVLLFLTLRHGRQPVPLPLTYAQIISSPYAQVVRIMSASGENVALAPGDHLTPMRVNGLRPGVYTLDLQAPGWPATKAQCSVNAAQHLCLAILAPLSDADLQAILQGGAHP